MYVELHVPFGKSAGAISANRQHCVHIVETKMMVSSTEYVLS